MSGTTTVKKSGNVTTEIMDLSGGLIESSMDADSLMAKMGGKSGTLTETLPDGTVVTYEMDVEEFEEYESGEEMEMTHTTTTTTTTSGGGGGGGGKTNIIEYKSDGGGSSMTTTSFSKSSSTGSKAVGSKTSTSTVTSQNSTETEVRFLFNYKRLVRTIHFMNDKCQKKLKHTHSYLSVAIQLLVKMQEVFIELYQLPERNSEVERGENIYRERKQLYDLQVYAK